VEQTNEQDQQTAQPKAPEVAFGIVIDMLEDGTIRVKQSGESKRDVNVHDVDYLLHRASTEALVQKVAAAVTGRQMQIAQQMRAASVMQQAAVLQAQQRKTG
jgi:hypothetical protein